MKIISISAILVLLFSASAMATGQTYDPYYDYYATYYGIGEVSEQNNEPTTKEVILKTSEKEDENSMADPSNYYNW